jgi:hypothetical protein
MCTLLSGQIEYSTLLVHPLGSGVSAREGIL